MQGAVIFLATLMFISCGSPSPHEAAVTPPKEAKAATAVLRDSLGTVSFYIPLRYDSFFTWTNHSDCGKTCDREEYRFQPKNLPVFRETGFYYHIPDIPMDQFTIIHSGYFPFRKDDTSANYAGNAYFKERVLAGSPVGQLVSDTIVRIYDRYLFLVGLKGFDSVKQNHFVTLAGLTNIRGNEIEFRYDIKSKGRINESQFFENANALLKTIRIHNGF